MPEARAPGGRRLLSAGLLATSALWPLLVLVVQARVEPGVVLSGLGVLLLLRLWLSRSAWLPWGLPVLAAMTAWGFLGGGWLSVKLYPCAVNAAMLLVFSASLLRPPSVIERIARLRDPALPSGAVPYTRAVTRAWCLFFVCNGVLAAATALWASDRVWALYNGVIAYGLMGAMFGGEMLVRRRAMARLVAAAAARELSHA